jgi:hypothetical protein
MAKDKTYWSNNEGSSVSNTLDPGSCWGRGGSDRGDGARGTKASSSASSSHPTTEPVPRGAELQRPRAASWWLTNLQEVRAEVAKGRENERNAASG